MPPRKRAAAKKTAAKKAAPVKKAAAKAAPPVKVPDLETVVDPGGDEVVEAPVPEPVPAEEHKTPAFPLSGGFYYAKPSVARSGVSKGPGVAQVREALGLERGFNFDSDTRKALVEFQLTRGLPVTGVVTSDVWEALHTPVE